MNLTDLAQAETWMDPEERRIADTLLAAFRKNFTERQIPENPFLALRLQNCLVQYILCRRIERSLTDTAEEDNIARANHVGRARERLRRSLKELEDTANKLTPSAEAPTIPALPTPVPPAHSTAGVPPASPRTTGVPPAPPLTAGGQRPTPSPSPSSSPIRPTSPSSAPSPATKPGLSPRP